MKNIIFDLGSVILRGKAVSVLDDFNLDDDVYNKLKVFFEDFKGLDLGKETLEEKYSSCNFPKEYDKLYKDILINYYKYRKMNKDLLNCINILKEKNYYVYVVSDNNKEVYEEYKKSDIFKNIDGWILSCEYNTIKEDGILFDILLKEYKLDPSECYFIDDKLVNIKEANKRGIKGYVFDENEEINKLFDDMRKYGIDI